MKIWLQDWGTYGEQTLMCWGGPTKRQILSYLKKIKAQEQFIKRIEADLEIGKDTDGMFWAPTQIPGSLMWIRSEKTDIKALSVLAHEIHHAVYKMLGERRDMMKEREGLAYQVEYLTKEILKQVSN